MARSIAPSAISAEGYVRAGELRPFVRAGMEHWRGPWFIAERRLLDYLLVYITEGTGRFSVGEETFEVAPGDLIWIPPDTLHEMRGHPPKMLVAYIHFDLAFDPVRSPQVEITEAGTRDLGALKPLLHPPWPRAPFRDWRGRLPVVNGPAVYALLKQVILESLGAHRPLRVSGLMLQLLDEIAAGLSPSAAKAGEHWPALRKAAQEVAETAGASGAALDLAALAHRGGLSLSHFRKLFRETHGESPRAMLERARMQKARELVLHSGWSMTRIAAQMGFSTVHNFSRAFKRALGESPRAFKRRVLAQKVL